MWVIAGLGNPGSSYSRHRHNVGFHVVDCLLKRWSSAFPSWKRQFFSECSDGFLKQQRAFLQKPQEYMNLSGRAVQAAFLFYKVPLQQVIVVHDDLDLPMGVIRVKQDGGDGGHNGLRSVSEHIGKGYVRVRCGIGRPHAGKEKVASYVLAAFSEDQKALAEVMVEVAADAVEWIVEKGVSSAMNQFHRSVEPPK